VALRCGTAKYSTGKSIETRNVGKPSTPSPTHSRGPAPGLVFAAVTTASLP
jgi:hypothetical protein